MKPSTGIALAGASGMLLSALLNARTEAWLLVPWFVFAAIAGLGLGMGRHE